MILRRTFQADGLIVEGFDDAGVLSERDRVRIGRLADADVRVTESTGRSVLGGATSYVLEVLDSGDWCIVHTGHIGSMSVDGLTHRKGHALVHEGSRVEIYDCDTGKLALAFTIEIGEDTCGPGPDGYSRRRCSCPDSLLKGAP